MTRLICIGFFVLGLLATNSRLQPTTAKDALIVQFKTPDRRIQDVAFSADNKLVAAGYGFYDDGGVTIWDISTRKVEATLLQQISKKNGIKRIAFSNDGKLFVAAGDKGDVMLWKVGEWRNFKKILSARGEATDLAFSPDSTKLAFSSEETALVYDILTNRIDVIAVGRESEKEFDGISFTPDGKSVVISGSTGTEIWDIESKKLAKKWNDPAFNFFGRLSPQGNYFVSGGGAIYGKKSVKIRSFSEWKLVKDLTQFRDGVFSLAISNSEKFFALSGGTYGGKNAGFVGLWGFGDMTEIGFTALGDSPIQAIAFSHDDSILGVGNGEGEVLLYDTHRFRGKQIEKQNEALCGEIQSRDGQVFLTGISKIPGIMRSDFVYPWRLEVANPASVRNAIGLPIVLTNWSIEGSSAEDKARIDEFKSSLNKDADTSNYIVFGVGENPGFGHAIKIFSDGTFVAANRSGKCLSYGNLSQLNTDYATVKTRLLDANFLLIPKEPMTIGADHFRTEFIEIMTGGVSEIRTDADSFELLMKEKGKTKKREAFSQISAKEHGFIDSLLKAGFR